MCDTVTLPFCVAPRQAITSSMEGLSARAQVPTEQKRIEVPTAVPLQVVHLQTDVGSPECLSVSCLALIYTLQYELPWTRKAQLGLI